MKLLHGQKLVDELRSLADSVEKRLWIAVPYIGSPSATRKILGRQWLVSPSISIKLLTDISNLSCIDTETIRCFHEKGGEIKTLTGLHAKIYIVDDTCLITSANLTNTAFSKRHEIGVLYDNLEANQVIEIFKNWWKISKNIKPDQFNKIFSKRRKSSEESIRDYLPSLWNLPNDPGSYNPDSEILVKQEEVYYIVNTNRKHSDTNYLEMLNEEKASAYGNRKNSIYRIDNGDRVFLYHKSVGIIAYGHTIDDAKPNDENEEGEVYIKMKFDWEIDPINEPEKAVKVSEINEELGSGYSFPQTVLQIPEEMAFFIKRLAIEKAPENMI